MTAIIAAACTVLAAVILAILATPGNRQDVQPLPDETIFEQGQRVIAHQDDENWGVGFSDGAWDAEDGRAHQVCTSNGSDADAAYWHGYSTGWLAVTEKRERKS